MIKHLIIPDAHVNPETDFSRFQALGNYILDTKPDKIIIIGDWFDFNSLSSFEKPGSKFKEGMRVKDDIKSGIEAYRYTMGPTLRGNTKTKRRKKKGYHPSVYFCEGNHEERMWKLERNDATMEGIFDYREPLKDVYPVGFTAFGDYITIDGLLYTHIPHARNGRPVASVVNTTGAVLRLVGCNIFFGHTHRLEFRQERLVGRELITACNVGCFIEYDDFPAYAIPSNPNWWSGVVEACIEEGMPVDITTLGIEQLKKGWL